MAVRLGSSVTRELARRLKPGYRFASSGRSKFFIIDPRGNKVRLADGRPVTVPCTPGGFGRLQRLEHTLRTLDLFR
jgi:hypothetical protein